MLSIAEPFADLHCSFVSRVACATAVAQVGRVSEVYKAGDVDSYQQPREVRAETAWIPSPSSILFYFLNPQYSQSKFAAVLQPT
jgi:hypothetical protein